MPRDASRSANHALAVTAQTPLMPGAAHTPPRPSGKSRRRPHSGSCSNTASAAGADDEVGRLKEQLARVSYDLRAEAAGLRQAHTKDLRILLEQPVALRAQVEALEAKVGGAGAAALVGLEASVAKTAQEAADLQLQLLLKQNTALQAELGDARAQLEASAPPPPPAPAPRDDAEADRLRAELRGMAARVEAAERRLAEHAAQPPTPPTQPPAQPSPSTSPSVGHLKQSNRRLRERLAMAEAHIRELEGAAKAGARSPHGAA